MVAHVLAFVVTALSDAIHDVSGRVLEKCDRARRRAVKLLAEGETVAQGKPGDASVIADTARFRRGSIGHIEGDVVAAIRRAIETVQNAVSIRVAAGNDVVVVDSERKHSRRA